MNKFTYLNYDTWLDKRNEGIGASDIPIILGESNFMTPLELWEIKTGKSKQVIDESLQTLFDAGHNQEPITVYNFLKSENDPLAEKVYMNHIKKKNMPKKGNIHLFTEFENNNIMFAHPDMIYNGLNIEAKFIRHKSLEWDFEETNEMGVPFKY